MIQRSFYVAELLPSGLPVLPAPLPPEDAEGFDAFGVVVEFVSTAFGVEDVTYERHSNYHYLFLQIRTVCGASDADKIALFLPWGLGLVTF
ncbi:hypothetical protein QUA81_30910 [Microcoleus sp. F6_B4]